MKCWEDVNESVAEGQQMITVSGTVDEWRRLLGYNAHTPNERVVEQLRGDCRTVGRGGESYPRHAQ